MKDRVLVEYKELLTVGVLWTLLTLTMVGTFFGWAALLLTCFAMFGTLMVLIALEVRPDER